MFEQSLLEKSQETTTRKRWTTTVSYSAEGLAILIALAFPLLHTEALPLDDSPKLHPPTRYSPERVQVIETIHQRSSPSREQVMINPYLAPQRIPKGIDRSPDRTPTGGGESVPSIYVGIYNPNGPQNPMLESMLRNTVSAPIHHATAPVVRTSHLQENLLIRQVKPIYPPLAKQARIQGPVVLQATIGRDGSIQHLQVLSGHPMLTKAAVDAVQQWRYRPYLLNGEAVEVETQITVNFLLNGN
jgi:protein TonB